MTELYDTIGVGYSGYRRPDPRIAAAITSALDGAETVVNVGAGTGSYEPQDRRVVAVEPSGQMIRQRSTTDWPSSTSAFTVEGVSFAALACWVSRECRRGEARCISSPRRNWPRRSKRAWPS